MTKRPRHGATAHRQACQSRLNRNHLKRLSSDFASWCCHRYDARAETKIHLTFPPAASRRKRTHEARRAAGPSIEIHPFIVGFLRAFLRAVRPACLEDHDLLDLGTLCASLRHGEDAVAVLKNRGR